MSFRGRQGRKAGRSVKKISVNPVSKDALKSSVSEYFFVVKKHPNLDGAALLAVSFPENDFAAMPHTTKLPQN